MKKTFTLIMLVGALAFQSAFASPESHRQAGIDLINAMDGKKVFLDTFVPVFNDQLQQSMQGSVPQPKIDQIKVAGAKMAQKIVDDPAFLEQMASIYTNSFSEAEIRQLIEFYNTPLGRKFLAETPAIGVKSSQVSDQMTNKHMAGFQAEVQAIMMAP